MKLSSSTSSLFCLIVYLFRQGVLSENVKTQKGEIHTDRLSQLHREEVGKVVLGQWVDLLQMSLPTSVAPTTSPIPTVSPSPTSNTTSPNPTVSPSPTSNTFASSTSSAAPSVSLRPTAAPSVSLRPTLTFSPTTVHSSTLVPTVETGVIPQQELCSLKLDFECHRLVNGTRLLCSDIAPVPSSDECIQKVEFQYIVTNNCFQPGCTDAFITNLEVQRDGNTTNLTALIPDPLVPPGNNVTAVEPFSLNFCQTRQFNVTSSVLARTTNTTTQAFCAADNVSKVKVQNANAVKSDAYAIDGLVTVRSRIGMYLFLAAVAGVMLI